MKRKQSANHPGCRHCGDKLLRWGHSLVCPTCDRIDLAKPKEPADTPIILKFPQPRKTAA